jgi:hypothetical protein
MFEKSLIISLIVLAIHGLFYDGMIFGRLGNWMRRNLPEWVNSPLFDCCYCMVPWWGTPAYWIIFGGYWLEGGVVILCAMGINFLFAVLLSLVE